MKFEQWFQGQLATLLVNSQAWHFLPSRSGGHRISRFGQSLQLDVSSKARFPLMTLRYTSFRNIVAELAWFLSGDTNIESLREDGCRIWDPWADSKGEVGPMYGYQWRRAAGRDQLRDVITKLETDPYSRQLVVNAWNVQDLPEMVLPPCHFAFQFHVHPARGGVYSSPIPTLNMTVYQRSADILVGVPYNVASYTLLLHLVAQEVGMEVGNLYFQFGDLHLYKNHIDAANTLSRREVGDECKLHLDPTATIDNFTVKSASVSDYSAFGPLQVEVAV